MIQTILSSVKIGVLMTLGFVLATLLLFGALALGIWVIEPICNVINVVLGRP